ncbi:hypothetical protein PN417_00460 [Halorubrum ezzemoulense]|uniref:hypothetical protein n=1 Tax=Halorubrum ezzemoulense TaxID=337243 RepID=UPI00232F9093|nr:hypothetical protein [Halorubrum ezzemoulense]MDB9299421.1 hypothetical protein [Halorubrum ezzemoulense]
MTILFHWFSSCSIEVGLVIIVLYEEGLYRVPSQENMSTEDTSVTVRRDQLEALDDAAESIFGTTEASKKAVVDRLLADHPDVAFEPTS